MSVFGRRLPAIYLLPAMTMLALAWPFINFANVNRTMIGLPQIMSLLTYFVTAVLLVLVGWCVLHLLPFVRMRVQQVDAALAFLVVVFFMYVPLMAIIASAFGAFGLSRGGVFAYAALWAAGGLAVYKLARHRNVRQIMWAFLAVAVALPLASLLAFAAVPREQNTATTQAEEASSLTLEDRPNVYFLVMDEYARFDRLQKYFGASDTGFLVELETRGFHINRNFYSNYPTTFLSLSSTLQMDYLALPERTFANRSTFINSIVGHGSVYEQFRKHGYSVAQASSKITSAGCQGAEDFCLDRTIGARLGELEFGLLNLTPVGVGLQRLALRFLPPVTLASFKATIAELPNTRPIFHFIHTNPPHAPFFLTDACGGGPVSDRDVDQRMPEMLKAYVTSVRCASQGALDFIDFLLSRDPSAMIVLQSDHGSDQTVDWLQPAADWTEEQTSERLAAFSAIRAPSRCNSDVERLRTAVNTFRVILACLERRPTKWLNDRLFIGSYETASDFGKVREVYMTDEQLP